MDVLVATPSRTWTGRINGDPLSWLLEPGDPAVRLLALRQLLDRPGDDPEARAALTAAMATDPIRSILAAQHPDGYWVKPGAGYGPKYTGTVWSLIFLDQLGADPADPRVRAACQYVLEHTQAETGGFAASGAASTSPPPPHAVIHCLNGNLLRALIGFGWLDDERVQRAIAWEANAITGVREHHYYKSGTCGPGFACAANDGLPCAWGATKALFALARIPPEGRDPSVQRAIDEAADFLLSVDPATAGYPAGYGNTKPNGSWFKLGFPSGYVADVLQVIEALCEAGHGGDARLNGAVDWLLAKQGMNGRWVNQYAYNGKTWGAIERQGAPSKWVTLRACRVLKSIDEQSGERRHA